MDDDAGPRRAADRTLTLLWRHRLGEPQGSRGPRQRVGTDDVVRVAIALADADGLEAFSLRKVAEQLGLAPMSLYTYVPGRAELIVLMVDEVAGECSYAPHAGPLRERMAAIARLTWNELQRHPWLLQVQDSRPGLGPHGSARYEWQLAAIEGVGLGDVEMDQAITLLTGFAEGAARAAVRARGAREESGMTDQEWWDLNAPLLARVMDEDDYPVSCRVGRAAGEAYGAATDPDLSVAFGLHRVRDGLYGLLAGPRPGVPAVVADQVPPGGGSGL